VRQQIQAAVAILLVGALIWVVYVQIAGRSLIPGVASSLASPEPDTTRLAELKEVLSISVSGVLGGVSEYNQGGRNLFQYGPPKPPPPTPAELEAMRRAEEARLKTLEEEARQRAEQQQKQIQEENERRAKAAADELLRQQEAQKALAAAGPRVPPPPPPPPINYRLVGYMGPASRRIAVLLNGNELVLGRQGDVLEGKFKLLSVGIDSVEMGYSDPAFKDAKKRIDLGS